MYDNIQQQNLADWILNKVSHISNPPERRMATLFVQAFENAPWYPQVFQQVVDEVGRFSVDAEKAVVEVQGEPGDIIPQILTRYLELTSQRLTIKQAQELLERSRLFKADGQPYTLVALKKAVAREQLPARLEQAPTPYNTVSLGDLLTWYRDENKHQVGRKRIIPAS